MPAKVPTTSEVMVERIAISSESVRAGQKLSREVTAPYQRNETPPVGKSNTGDGDKLTAAITISGAMRKRAAPAITA